MLKFKNNSSPQSAKVILFNAASICNKVHELSLLVATEKPDLVAVTETNCNTSIHDSLLHMKGYDLIRCDRHQGSKGGVLLLVRSTVAVCSIVLMAHPSGTWEALKCDLQFTDNTLRVACIYRSPGNMDHNTENDFLTFFNSIIPNNSRKKILIVGDFNFPNIDWSSLLVTKSSPTLATPFLDTVLNAALTQHVNFPTRFRTGNTPSLLDLVLTNTSLNVSTIEAHPPVGKSDHVVIMFTLPISVVLHESSTARLNYSKADLILIDSMLASIDWTDELSELSAEASLAVLDNFLNDLRDFYVPLTKSTKQQYPDGLITK